MIPYDTGLARAMHQERLREAEQRRLAKIAGAKRLGPIERLRAALSRQMAVWGQRRAAVRPVSVITK